MSIVRYTVIRVALVAAFAGLFYLVGMRSYLLAFAAIICGALAGFIFFPGQGQEAAGAVEALTTKRRPRQTSQTDEDIEDDLIDPSPRDDDAAQ